MAKQYRVNAFVRINNAMISSLLRLGIKVGSFSLLTIRGRKSDLRAAGGEATLVRGRNTEKIHAIELEPESAAPILREAVRSGPPGIPTLIFLGYRALFVFPYLNVTENSSLEEFEREAQGHPIFLLQSTL